MLLKSRGLVSLIASSRIGVNNVTVAHVTKSKTPFIRSLSTNAAEVFEEDEPKVGVTPKSVLEKVPKKGDLESAIRKETMIQEQEATSQQVQQLSEQMETAFNKEKEMLEDNNKKVNGASAQQFWQTNHVSIATSSDEKQGEQQSNSMFGQLKDTATQMSDDIKDAAKGTLEDTKEKLKETLSTPSSEAEKPTGGRRSGGRKQEGGATQAGEQEKERSKQYSENKQNASIL